MKTVLILSALAILSQPTLRAEETQGPPVNPAPLYWQAAALLPSLSEAQATELHEIAAGKQPVDTAKLKALEVDSAAASVRRAAASTAPCDWGLYKEGDPRKVGIPPVPKILRLANLAIAEAEASLSQGKKSEGLDWLLTAHRIARHCGADQTMTSFLLQSSIETMALQAAARHCLDWDEATRCGYAEKLKELPPLSSSQESYRSAMGFIEWLEGINQLSEPRRTAELDAGFTEVGSASPQTFFPRWTAETLAKELAEFRKFYVRTEAAFGKSWKEGNRDLDAINKDMEQSGSTLVKAAPVCIGNTSFYKKTFSIATLRTMLDAVLEHGAQLDDSLAASYRDVFEGKPLRLQKSSDGGIALIVAEAYPKEQKIQLEFGR
jgi:hypothetical protein